MNNTLWAVVDKITLLSFGFLPFVVITRNFSKSDIGTYSLISMLIMSVWALSSGGVKPIYIKYIVKYRTAFFRRFYLVYVLVKAGILFILFLALVIYFECNDLSDIYTYSAILLYSLVVFEPVHWSYELEFKQKKVAMTRFFTSVVFIFIKLYVIFHFETINMLLVVLALENLSFHLLLCANRKWKRHTRVIGCHLHMSGWKFIVTKSFPLLLSQLLVLTYCRIDQLMIASLSGSEDLADYSVALKIVEPFNIFPMAICATALPVLVASRLKGGDINKAKGYFCILFLLAACIAMPLFLWGQLVISILFGAEFSGLDTLIQILSFTIIFNFIAIYNGMLLVLIDQQRLAPLRSLVGVGVNIVLNYSLIPAYGAVGAALATLVTLVLSGCVFYYLSNETSVIRVVNFKGVFAFRELHKLKA